jgi:hypothetical protein
MERKYKIILIKLALLFSMIFAVSNNCVYADSTSIDPVHDDKINYVSEPIVYLSMDRVGATTSVRCFLHYNGPYTATYFRFGTISVYSPNYLTNTLYDTIEGGYDNYYFYPSGTYVSKYLGIIHVPVGESSVRVSSGTIVIGNLTEEYGLGLSSTNIPVN